MRRVSLMVAAASIAVALVFPTVTAAHNRGLVWLPSGECVQVGSLKSVYVLGKGTYQDLDPSDGGYPNDEYGTSFAASRGNSAVEKGACPFHPGR